ncbi:MAG: patatin-like phospholipase family protein [Bacteroidota bacterium]
MKAQQFTHNADVRSTIKELRAWQAKHPAGAEVSDIIDADGNQYVDLVMEGGGVLGIGLLGYTYAMEQVGIRFRSIAGTSAGSIAALLFAAYDTAERPKSAALAVELAKQDLREFVDGDSDAHDFTDALLRGAGLFGLGLKFVQVLDNFREDLGLHPGDAFKQWIQTILEQRGVRTSADLEHRMAHRPRGLKSRDGNAQIGPARLALITAEITTETKVEFPEMAPLFWPNPQAVNPAEFVRASMSVPFFFHPYRVANLPQGIAAQKLWDEIASYNGPVPQQALFMDGGIVSNFPIDVFHEMERVPLAPTFGAKLGTDRRTPQHVENIRDLTAAVFNTARHALDYDFITRNPDYSHLVTCIDTAKHNWLNFSIKDADKVDLFRRGVDDAANFLMNFDWQNYKQIRADLMRAFNR